ncbi:biotin--[acetyl-CoA-carboxylase] ligase [Stappia sp. ES.058]|uniref:biotin--[acetyl-CoA-carboxylase] ligase n=1 Tax=Stappia sp. ES.058 TaxID=1881061 RepID=UPI0018D48759|nr:biotin--[acetyl-CoA-carboxylase] ligase [Stappia sp. ES.058]
MGGFETVSSTNAVALDFARKGDPGNLWIVGQRQTGGRGRRGRPWVSEPGNLYASLLLIDPADPVRLAQLPLVAALALADAVDRMCGTHRLVRLKWPNDLLVDGAKISGILLEAAVLADGRRAVACGFGLNLSHHPELPDYAAADLAGLGYRVTAESGFAALAESVSLQLDRWRNEPFSGILADWISRATGIGNPIRVRLSQDELHGTFVGLDEEGRLLLRGEDGSMTTISAGDVFF